MNKLKINKKLKRINIRLNKYKVIKEIVNISNICNIKLKLKTSFVYN